MNFGFPYICSNDDERNRLLIKYLKQWTEMPLSDTEGYEIETVRFFDGFIGTLIRQTENDLKYDPGLVDYAFLNTWQYSGRLYRVLHQQIEHDKEGKKHCRLPRVRYHGLIAHWTTDYTFKKLLYKLSDKTKYIILEADTKDHLGFDVNEFRKAHNCASQFTEAENEVIFPMYKDCIKEYRMTISEFVNMKNKQ